MSFPHKWSGGGGYGNLDQLIRDMTNILQDLTDIGIKLWYSSQILLWKILAAKLTQVDLGGTYVEHNGTKDIFMELISALIFIYNDLLKPLGL